ncbi:MAG: phosphoesterase, partial [Desulfovibrionaceae bacterium]|nr:phosphoesterase [Desulfovibrionaceae bacterium]
MRVHGIPWVVVSGECNDKLVVILRGDGLRKDMGKFSAGLFGEFGSAGGHKAAARAEMDLSALSGSDPEMFMLKKLGKGKKWTFKRG